MADGEIDTTNLPIVMTVQDVIAVLKSSRSVIYPKISSGEIPSFTVGRARRIKRDDFLAWLAAQPVAWSPSSSYRPPNSRTTEKAPAA